MVVSVFAVRLFQLQGLDAAAYAAQARAVGAVQEVLPATRGAITDRNGEPLAESLDGMMIVADPTKTKDDAAEIASVLEDRLGIDYIDAVENLAWPDPPCSSATSPAASPRRRRPRSSPTSPSWATRASTPGATRCAATRPRTSAPTSSAGSTTRATAPTAPSCCSKLLAGKDGSATYDIGGGNRIPLGDNSVTEPVDGKDVALTIDRDVQWYTQRVLRQTVEDVGAESGSAIVMDTQTGAAALAGRLPDLRPQHRHQRHRHPAARLPLAARGLRAGLGREGAHHGRAASTPAASPRAPSSTVPGQLVSSGMPINDHWEHGTHRR